jgi:polysaccharide export outer membrane protein
MIIGSDAFRLAPRAPSLAACLLLCLPALPLARAAAQSPSGDAAPPPAAAQPAAAQPAAGAKPGAAAMAPGGLAPLLPGDIVRVKIWREPDLSGEFPVEEGGAVILPKLGPRQVVGRPPDSVKAGLAREYLAFLNHTSVDITLLRRVQVTGAVRNPGLYPVDPSMTIGDALALAGGVTGNGKKDQVELLRYGEPVTGRLSGRTRIADSPLRSGDQLYVPERSWISRNPGLVITSFGLLTGLIFRAVK